MAITSSTPTITTCVKVNNASLQEYTNPATTDSGTTTTRYIEALTGQIFEIHADIAAGTPFVGDCLAFYISVDGKMADPTLTFLSGTTHTGSSVVSKGIYTAGNMVRKYRFEELGKTNDGGIPSKEQVEAAMELGTIRVEVHHQMSKARVDGGLDLFGSLKTVDAIDERAVKGRAISSTTSYAEAVANDGLHVRYWDTEFLDPDMKPMAVFVFKYTSREDLQAMDMIPRDPTTESEETEPESEEAEPDIATMTHEEMAAELRERRQAEKDATVNSDDPYETMEVSAYHVQIKREHMDDDQRPTRDKRFKTIITLGDDGEELEVVTTLLPGPEAETIT
ncbi:hypothetical protein DOTSEDRAFT_39561 [Dothistroma septosporum NZE10]|uniref:DUF7918 domain-containing protein n=1 Tax=Dothistroma septosporum (strain NZE10 / CBS 128990) TaxID=675120 RepID=N1PCK3_DOTSN|nr:hypothetical protein DOTSEDRAFT_39561 [Dothistroma septosporum NZE10]